MMDALIVLSAGVGLFAIGCFAAMVVAAPIAVLVVELEWRIKEHRK